ncbi:glycoside hydrolase family 15 protein [Blastopirellula sp. JC732]|uniref:Glycoside hydrolase family 15 protein n=1 Tax=Blastopirellula sediminis TaxID=2894196 RepID=A0A9X1SF57_9BACT|nr:glycoside hydrolase family 15 protein [Blastopirellula sediminis]MCC9607986.1 glycoside hydrolase family 15 protein [Blastopirellula sediminis]MCC9627221.1 glycoside hydrolase family 15 protein [Blastopirellula sediminis]
MNDRIAPGAPGIEPRWTSSAKDGLGTAYHSGSHVWFTLSHGIVNEIYYPHVDSPNTRDLQLLVTDGESFFHEEKRDLTHKIERPEPHALLYRLTNTCPNERYRIVKEVISEPHTNVVLMNVKIEILDPALENKLKIFVLLAPHLADTGEHNTAKLLDLAGKRLLHAKHDIVDLVLGCDTDFVRRSVGYVGVSDGWRDLRDNFQMDWEYELAEDGNVAMMGEVDLSRGLEFNIGVAMGHNYKGAATQLLQAFLFPFELQRKRYIEQWKRTIYENPMQLEDHATASLVRLSQCVLMAHEDKMFAGATVASMSIPWGETKDDSDSGGYHLVWARDMVQTTTALLACGEKESPLRALTWLSCVQRDDGGMPQNSRIDGTAYWNGVQLDEIAAPVILAWRLQQVGGLAKFDPSIMVRRAVRFLILHGPVTAQERWEENEGYSPSTLAALIAAIICAADFADLHNDPELAEFLRDYGDWAAASLEKWTVTDCGELVPGKPRHYVRITPASPHPGCISPDPNREYVQIANGGGEHLARNIVDGGFLQLVRLGVRAADDPIIVDTVAVIDEVLKYDLPQGPCWRRYNHDGYGQHPDGSAFNGTGEGRCWPLLTGERGFYEMAAGRDPSPYIKAIEGFANDGGMLTEQVWDADDIPEKELFFGGPTGAAMPLCWAHAEYITLVRSRSDGVVFDRIESVYQRYAVEKTKNRVEIWTFAHQPAEMPAGKPLRIICDAPFVAHWSDDEWKTRDDVEARENALGLYVVDLPIGDQPPGATVIFTFHWIAEDRWEEQDYSVKIV